MKHFPADDRKGLMEVYAPFFLDLPESMLGKGPSKTMGTVVGLPGKLGGPFQVGPVFMELKGVLALCSRKPLRGRSLSSLHSKF